MWLRFLSRLVSCWSIHVSNFITKLKNHNLYLLIKTFLLRSVIIKAIYVYLPTLTPASWNLTPTHAYGPNSHAWMKTVSYKSLNWNTFLKDVNLHLFQKRKLHVIEIRFLWFLTRKALGTRSRLAKNFLGLGPRDVKGELQNLVISTKLKM